MKIANPIDGLKRWYSSAEAKGLAKLTPDERAELLAFDASFKKHSSRNVAIIVVLWLAVATLVKVLLVKIGWFGAMALSAVLLMSLTVAITGAWFGPSRFKSAPRSFILLVVLTLAGALLGALAGGMGANAGLPDGMARLGDELMRIAPKVLMGGLIAGLVYAVLMVSIVQYRRSQLQGRNEQLLRQAQQERMGRQLADARLKLMQAQVEPHFLFNTLASVQTLAEGKAPEAARLTAQLITFLRAGLAGLREDISTLGREFKSMEAYLSIMQTRMPERLQYSLDLPDDLKDVEVPPAMLISLVENAIKHGLEPSPEGGSIDVQARSDGGRLRITVTDTGQGVNAATSGGGVGLDNIRQRLRALFADKAKLIVSQNQPHGFIAIIDLPLLEGTKLNMPNPATRNSH